MSTCNRGHYNSERDAGRHCILCRRENQMRAYYKKKGMKYVVSPSLMRVKSEGFWGGGKLNYVSDKTGEGTLSL